LSDDGARSEVFGPGSLLNIPGRQVAIKTGTTDDKRDNYAIGYTPSVVAGVWVGNNNNDPMNPYVASGISGASPIWNKFMTAYLKDKPVEKFVAPKTVKKLTVDKLTGGLPYKDFDTKSEWFAQNTEPTAVSDWYQRITVCSIDGRVANSACIDAGKDKNSDFIKIKAELPIWQSDVDAWIKDNYGNDSKYFPPLMTSKLQFDGSSVTNKDEVSTQIVGLINGDQVPLSFRLTAEVSCANHVDKVTFYMDDKSLGEDNKSPYAKTIDLKASDIGTHKFRVVAKDTKGNKGEYEISLNVIGYTN
jgi:membrane carboxypeptidase/penicillin-binding protein PbpC